MTLISELACSLALLDQARPTQKALRDACRFIKPELAQVQDVKGRADFITDLFLGHHRRPRIVWLARVAGQDQASTASSHVPRHGWGVLVRRASTNGMVTTAIEKEFKRSIQIRQIKDIGDHEIYLNSRRASSFFRSPHGQRNDVYRGNLKTLLGQPDAIGSRATAQFERPTGSNGVFMEDTLQLRGGPTGVPRQIAILVSRVPIYVLCHGILSAILRGFNSCERSGY
jgi:hypothetical protein